MNYSNHLPLALLADISTVDGFSSVARGATAQADILRSCPPRVLQVNKIPLHKRRQTSTAAQESAVTQRQRLTALFISDQDNDDSSILDSSSSRNNQSAIYTPLNRPLLATIDTISLIIFAAIGKSSHNTNGDLDIFAVLLTALPFVTAWLSTSPLTATYSPDDTEESNLITSTAKKVVKGWAVAIPLGIALRGVIKGYVPPVPFIIVTLISTLVILIGVRVLFAIAEDVFVELVN